MKPPKITAAFLLLLTWLAPLPAADRIVHILDWHYIERDTLAPDLRSQSYVSDAEIDRQHAKLVEEVAATQEAQIAILRRMIKEEGLRAVYIEGLTERDTELVSWRVATLKQSMRYLARAEEIAGGFDELGIETDLPEQLARFHRDHHHAMLHFGAAGRLKVLNELAELLPVESYDARRTANPVRGDGTVAIDEEAQEAREDAMVSRLMQQDGTVVIILGGAHDLAANIERRGGDVEYERIAPEG